MKRKIFLILLTLILSLIFSFNITYSQGGEDPNTIREQINNLIDQITRIKLNKIVLIYFKYKDDNTHFIYDCRFEENDNPHINIGSCRWANNNGYYTSKFIEVLREANNTLNSASSISNDSFILRFWQGLHHDFPHGNQFNGFYEEEDTYRHLLLLTLGVARGYGLMDEIVYAKDIIVVHVLNNDGPEGTNYREYFDNNFNFDISNPDHLLWKSIPDEREVSSTLLNKYLDYLKNNDIIEKMIDFTEYFSASLAMYDFEIKNIYECYNLLNTYIRVQVRNISSVDTLKRIHEYLQKFNNYLTDPNSAPNVVEKVFKYGFLGAFPNLQIGGQLHSVDVTEIDEDNETGQPFKRNFLHIFPDNLQTAIDSWSKFHVLSSRIFYEFETACATQTILTGTSTDNRSTDEVLDSLGSSTKKLADEFGFSYALLEVATQEISLAVIPPVVWSDEHRGVESLAQITPQRIFDEVKNFLFSLAPIMFIFLLIGGGIFYLLSPIKVEYIKTGSEYIKWAVVGYFLLLVVSAIFSALKFIFGSP